MTVRDFAMNDRSQRTCMHLSALRHPFTPLEVSPSRAVVFLTVRLVPSVSQTDLRAHMTSWTHRPNGAPATWIFDHWGWEVDGEWLVLVCLWTVWLDTSDRQNTLAQVPKTGSWGESFTYPQRHT